MRVTPIPFLLLLAAHPSGHHGFHHGGMPNWRMGSHDGSSPRDFGRRLSHREGSLVPREALREALREPRRFDRLEVGNGARVGFGFVHGRHLGLRFGKSF